MSWKYKVKSAPAIAVVHFQGMEVRPLIRKSETRGMASYYIRLPKNTVIPPSYHKVAREIIFVLSGRGNARLNGKTVRIKKGSAILVQPGTWHSFSTSKYSMRLLAVTSPYVDSKTDLYHD